MDKFIARLFVYGSMPFRFVWTFFSEVPLAFRLALTEVRYPEMQVREVLRDIAMRKRSRPTPKE